MTENQQLIIHDFLQLSHQEKCDIVELLQDYFSNEPYKFEKRLIAASRKDFGTEKRRPQLRLVS